MRTPDTSNDVSLDFTCRRLSGASPSSAPSLTAFAGLWRRVDAMWRTGQARGPAPPRALLDITAMRDYLDFVTLVDVIVDPGSVNAADCQSRDYNVRVYGTGLAQLYGADLTGERLSAVTSQAAALHRRCFDEALAAQAPIHFAHALAEDAYAARVEGLCCPLSVDGRTIGQLVCLEAPLAIRRAPAPYL